MYVAIACYTCMHVHLDVHTRIYVASYSQFICSFLQFISVAIRTYL